MPDSTLTTFAFAVLGIAFAGFWISKRPWVWQTFLLASLVLAIVSHVVNGVALAAGIPAAVAIYAYFRVSVSPAWKWILGILMSVLSLGLFAHFFPGFREVPLYSNLVLSPGAYPTSLFWNFDKPLAGLLMIGWSVVPVFGWANWKQILPPALGLYAACAAWMIVGGCALHVIRWAPHWTAYTTLFAWTNLWFVTIPEEAFFRGFVQRELASAFSGFRRGNVWTIGIGAVIFGLCHFQGGAGLMLTATVAGIFYGEAYRRTGRIEASILVHFLLNLSHFVLFSYPALRQ